MRIRRTIGTPALDYLDPFLLLDEFKSAESADANLEAPLRIRVASPRTASTARWSSSAIASRIELSEARSKLRLKAWMASVSSASH